MTHRAAMTCLMRAYLFGCALVTHQQAWVWASDLTLWRHAVELAPQKPRPALNYGSALLLTGDVHGAAIWWARALELSRQPHVKPWDATRTQASARANLARLSEALQ